MSIMTMDDAFFEELAAINADMESAGARLDLIGANDGSVLVVDHSDTKTMEAIATLQAAQKRLSELLARVNA